jgi:hypothetical protein
MMHATRGGNIESVSKGVVQKTTWDTKGDVVDWPKEYGKVSFEWPKVQEMAN